MNVYSTNSFGYLINNAEEVYIKESIVITTYMNTLFDQGEKVSHNGKTYIPFVRDHQCFDSNKDHKCDECFAIKGIHKIETGKEKCDYCGATSTECYDMDNDHKCDMCSATVRAHFQAKGKHICDYCGKETSKCDDFDKDHKCNTCSATVGEHKPVSGGHICAYCMKVASECVDKDSDYRCEICKQMYFGEVLVTMPVQTVYDPVSNITPNTFVSDKSGSVIAKIFIAVAVVLIMALEVFIAVIFVRRRPQK